jgi:hypothetical protein
MKRLFESHYGLVLAIALLLAGLSAAAGITSVPASPAPRYFGEEFAAAHRALDPKPVEEVVPTF